MTRSERNEAMKDDDNDFICNKTYTSKFSSNTCQESAAMKTHNSTSFPQINNMSKPSNFPQN
jgi:hypothetical protein